MDPRRINIEDVKSVLKRVGFEQEECEQCSVWNSPKVNESLSSEDSLVAELTPEEQECFLESMPLRKAGNGECGQNEKT